MIQCKFFNNFCSIDDIIYDYRLITRILKESTFEYGLRHRLPF